MAAKVSLKKKRGKKEGLKKTEKKNGGRIKDHTHDRVARRKKKKGTLGESEAHTVDQGRKRGKGGVKKRTHPLTEPSGPCREGGGNGRRTA